MRVYRISKPQYIKQALSGIGAARNPGRWNSHGTRLTYTASSVALAILESLAHVSEATIPSDWMLLGFDVPDACIATLPRADYPDGWNQLPYCATVRRLGDQWTKSGTSLALRVPSAIAQPDFNLLINPAHPRICEVEQVSVEPFVLDRRFSR